MTNREGAVCLVSYILDDGFEHFRLANDQIRQADGDGDVAPELENLQQQALRVGRTSKRLFDRDCASTISGSDQLEVHFKSDLPRGTPSYSLPHYGKNEKRFTTPMVFLQKISATERLSDSSFFSVLVGKTK